MNKKILYLFMLILISGCQTTKEDIDVEILNENEKSFIIPFFNEIINYNSEKDNDLSVLNEKEYMLLIMNGQIEINKGNNIKALEYFEKSLNIKYSEISYSILGIYFKENNYLKAKEISELILKNGLSKNKKYENLIISLINKDKENIYNISKEIIDKKNNDIYTYKNIAEIFYFTKNEPSIIKDLINKDDYVLIEFFYKYNLSNSKGDEPDEALNFLIMNKNKTNILHNMTIVKIGDVENYHINAYIDEALFLIENLDNYDFEISILDKLYKYNKKEYEFLKSKLITKHNDNYIFWTHLSYLEKEEIEKSLFNRIKAYEIIKKNKILVQNKDLYISNIINLKIKNNDFKIKSFIKEFDKKEDRIKTFHYLVEKMIIKNSFNYDYLFSMQSLIGDQNVDYIIAKSYYKLRKYDLALSYINKAEEEFSNIEDLTFLKILILGGKNKKIGLNEAEIYHKDKNTFDSLQILLHMKLINNIEIEKGFEILNKIETKKINSYTKYLKYNYAYKLKKYKLSKEIINSMDINEDYLYLIDQGKILWKLNEKEEAIKSFKKSKEIYDSLYIKETIKELNINKELI